MSPYFPVPGDLCWTNFTGTPQNITGADDACGWSTWSSEGWKEGHLSLANNATWGGGGNHTVMYSYDVFNELINYLGNPLYFPNLRNITLFGFSAGAQTLLRYASLSTFHILNPMIVKPRFVISDPSTYLYMGPERPITVVDETTGNETVQFKIPTESWIARFKTTESGEPWIAGWSVNCSKTLCCERYNEWRFGLNRLTGYFARNIGPDPIAAAMKKATLVATFPDVDITYLLGTEDHLNCKVNAPPPSPPHTHVPRDDTMFDVGPACGVRCVRR